jgi:hypothetical protein
LKSFLKNELLEIGSKFLIILCIFFFVSIAGYGQEEGIFDSRTNILLPDQTPPSLSIFDDRSTLKVDIETDQQQLFSNLDDEKKQNAILTLYINDSIKIVKKIRIKVRGNTRKAICDLPPLKLDLNDTDFLKEWLGDITSLKIVNTCTQNIRSAGDLQKEYIMYEMYTALTDISYRVRLLNLRIRDSQKKEDDITGYAFFLENDKSVAARTGLVEIEQDETSVSELLNTFYMDPREETLFNMTVLSIYEYMVGNTDWHITGLHNVKIFGNKEVKYAIPFDFDYSGFVNADYAITSSSIPVKNNRERYYMGPCGDKAIFGRALDTVLSKKEVFYQKIAFNPYLRKSEKSDLRSYLDTFFKEAYDKKSLVNKLSGFNCQY